MSRQHCTPLFLASGAKLAVSLVPLSQQAGAGAVTEADIQKLVHAHPTCLPISEIDPMFAGPVPICTELETVAGFIDNFMVTPSGLPVLLECKLWRNPEGRREVVGQILDYAKELSRWSSSDLQREVRRRLKQTGDPLLELVRKAHPEVDEVEFSDALTLNLRRGRFLLLIVGDGIREGVEAIAEYLQAHAGLHFSLGLVELPFYSMPGGGHLVVPRVLVRTEIITRTVVAVPDGYGLAEQIESTASEEVGEYRNALANEQQEFWSEFLAYVKLDDPEQRVPKPARSGNISFMMPAPNGSNWLTAYRDMNRNEVGIFMNSFKNSPGEYSMNAIVDDWDAVSLLLGGSVHLSKKEGRLRPSDSLKVGPLNEPAIRRTAFPWLAERVNTFVNVLRPRVRAASADFESKA